MAIQLTNTKEIKGILRVIERDGIVRVKKYVIGGITTEDYTNKLIVQKYKLPLVLPEKCISELNEIYQYYFSVDYDGGISYQFRKEYHDPYQMDIYELRSLKEYLTDLLLIMRKAEKYNEYIEICKENKIF